MLNALALLVCLVFTAPSVGCGPVGGELKTPAQIASALDAGEEIAVTFGPGRDPFAGCTGVFHAKVYDPTGTWGLADGTWKISKSPYGKYEITKYEDPNPPVIVLPAFPACPNGRCPNAR